MNSKELVLLQHKSTSIKKRFVRMYKNANAGHVGSSLSVAEIITFVRFGWMLESDEIIVSKGHAAAALYSMLAEDGTITEDDIATFYKNGTYLAAHPPVNKIKKVPFATGSLGHGLGLAVGLGLAQKIKKSSKKVTRKRKIKTSRAKYSICFQTNPQRIDLFSNICHQLIGRLNPKIKMENGSFTTLISMQ